MRRLEVGMLYTIFVTEESSVCDEYSLWDTLLVRLGDKVTRKICVTKTFINKFKIPQLQGFQFKMCVLQGHLVGLTAALHTLRSG